MNINQHTIGHYREQTPRTHCPACFKAYKRFGDEQTMYTFESQCKCIVKPLSLSGSLIRESSVVFCPYCGSSASKRFVFWGDIIKCILPQCINYGSGFKYGY